MKNIDKKLLVTYLVIVLSVFLSSCSKEVDESFKSSVNDTAKKNKILDNETSYSGVFPVPRAQNEFLQAVGNLKKIPDNLVGTRSAEKDEVVAKELGDSLQMISSWVCKVVYSNPFENYFSTMCLLVGPFNNISKNNAIIFTTHNKHYRGDFLMVTGNVITQININGDKSVIISGADDYASNGEFLQVTVP